MAPRRSQEWHLGITVTIYTHLLLHVILLGIALTNVVAPKARLNITLYNFQSNTQC